MTKKINPVRETDDEALALVQKLLAETRYASLGVNEPETGVPLVSRIAAAWHKDIGFFFAASDLSAHSKALLSDEKCSIMIGEPGKGDGLAYPRMTIVGDTSRMENSDKRRAEYREHFLLVHPKAELYIDFADFGFYRLNVQRILLNGGFGKAYHLSEGDLECLKL